MAETEYRDDIIMEVFQREVTKKLGAEAWDKLIEDIGIGKIYMITPVFCVRYR